MVMMIFVDHDNQDADGHDNQDADGHDNLCDVSMVIATHTSTLSTFTPHGSVASSRPH